MIVSRRSFADTCTIRSYTPAKLATDEVVKAIGYFVYATFRENTEDIRD
jgi:hypothetical protein